MDWPLQWEEFGRIVFEQSTSPIMIVDADGVYRDINPAACGFFERPRGEVVGKRVWDFVPPDQMEKQRREHSPFFSSRSVETDYLIGGRIKTLMLSVVPVEGPRGVLLYGFGQEITERKIHERELRRARDSIIRILDEFPNPVWRSDTEGGCDYFNQAWLALTGRSVEQEIGDGWAEGVHPDDKEACVSRFLESLARREPFYMEYRMMGADRRYHWIANYGSPFLDPDGEYGGHIGSCYDVTEQKELEASMAFLNDGLHLVNRIIRHDIRNQTMIISGALGMMERSEKRSMEMAKGALDRILRLLDRSRALESFITHGGPLKWMSVREVAEKVLRDYDVGWRIDGDCMVLADGTLENLIDNLVNNAIVHGETKRIEITMEGEGKGCAIKVIDFGKGVPEVHRENIFLEGFRYGSAGGTGLGLYLVRKVMDRFGGSVTLEANEAGGVTFLLRFPFSR